MVFLALRVDDQTTCPPSPGSTIRRPMSSMTCTMTDDWATAAPTVLSDFQTAAASRSSSQWDEMSSVPTLVQGSTLWDTQSSVQWDTLSSVPTLKRASSATPYTESDVLLSSGLSDSSSSSSHSNSCSRHGSYSRSEGSSESNSGRESGRGYSEALYNQVSCEIVGLHSKTNH